MLRQEEPRQVGAQRRGEDAANLLQKLCDEVGTHLWMDMELFLFTEDNALYPRPIDGLLSGLRRFQNFEKVLGYQYPDLLHAPWSSRQPAVMPR